LIVGLFLAPFVLHAATIPGMFKVRSLILLWLFVFYKSYLALQRLTDTLAAQKGCMEKGRIFFNHAGLG
jgi:hypothetical protein